MLKREWVVFGCIGVSVYPTGVQIVFICGIGANFFSPYRSAFKVIFSLGGQRTSPSHFLPSLPTLSHHGRKGLQERPLSRGGHFHVGS